MDGYTVDPAELTEAAAVLLDCGSELSDSPALRYGINPEQCGVAALAEALTEFQRRSEQATLLLADTASKAAEKLRHTASDYSEVDSRNAAMIEAPGSAPEERPVTGSRSVLTGSAITEVLGGADPRGSRG